MTKLPLDEISAALQAANVEPDKQDKVIEHLNQVIKELEDQKAQNPTVKTKNEFGVLLIDELGEIKTENVAALIYQVKVGDNHNLVKDQINKIIKEFNQTKKGTKKPVKSVTEAFTYIPPKIFKNNNLIKKTKEIVRCVLSDNKV